MAIDTKQARQFNDAVERFAPTNHWLQYANRGATRNRDLHPRLVQALSFLPELGLELEVFSGGQPAAGGGPRVGSTRHDHGNAADVFFRRNGQRLDWARAADQAIFQEIVRRGRAAGITGFGAGPGYMQPGSMHIGFGSPGVWGAGGKGATAPEWLRSAYYGGNAGPAPQGPMSVGAPPGATPFDTDSIGYGDPSMDAALVGSRVGESSPTGPSAAAMMPAFDTSRRSSPIAEAFERFASEMMTAPTDVRAEMARRPRKAIIAPDLDPFFVG